MSKVLITTTISVDESVHVDTKVVEGLSPAEADHMVTTINNNRTMGEHT